MGVDYYPCTNCNETFPDCGEYHTCDQEHMLCAYCMRNVPQAKETDDENGWFDSKYCPTCAKGGSTSQRLAATEKVLSETVASHCRLQADLSQARAELAKVTDILRRQYVGSGRVAINCTAAEVKYLESLALPPAPAPVEGTP